MLDSELACFVLIGKTSKVLNICFKAADKLQYFLFPQKLPSVEAQTRLTNRNKLTYLNVTLCPQIELNSGMYPLPPAALATERPAAHSAVSFCEAIDLHLSQRFRYESLTQLQSLIRAYDCLCCVKRHQRK